MKLKAERSQCLVVDMQARLVPAIHDHHSLVERVRILQAAAARLAIPCLATEQSPGSLGESVPEVTEFLAAGARIPKVTFDATGGLELRSALDAGGPLRRQIVVCGAEAHVCVMQTALGLHEEGYQVFIAADAVGSRKPPDREAALERMRQAGLAIVTTEMVVFEWLGRSDRPEFKDVLNLIK